MSRSVARRSPIAFPGSPGVQNSVDRPFICIFYFYTHIYVFFFHVLIHIMTSIIYIIIIFSRRNSSVCVCVCVLLFFHYNTRGSGFIDAGVQRENLLTATF